jgi:hypothetical protein
MYSILRRKKHVWNFFGGKRRTENGWQITGMYVCRYTRCTWAGGTTEFSRIIDWICWSCFFCFVIYVKYNTTSYVRTYGRTIRIYWLTDGQMDRRTDELIWGGLGNLRFFQVYLGRYLPNLSPISNTACLPIIHSSVALPSHAIPSPASAAVQWWRTWWGWCWPWLSLLLTSGCS